MKYELLKLEEFDRFYQILSNNFPTKEIKEYNYSPNLGTKVFIDMVGIHFHAQQRLLAARRRRI